MNFVMTGKNGMNVLRSKVFVCLLAVGFCVEVLASGSGVSLPSPDEALGTPSTGGHETASHSSGVPGPSATASGFGGHTATAASHQPAPSHGGASAADHAAVAGFIKNLSHARKETHFEKKVTARDMGQTYLVYGFGAVLLLSGLVLTYLFSRVKDERGDSRLQWTLGSRIIGGVCLIVILLGGLGLYSVRSMNQIGVEIETIAEEIIPITNAVANMETHQLEQAIVLERAFRFGEEEGSHAKEMFEKEIEIFEEFSQEISTELTETHKFLESVPAYTETEAEEIAKVMNDLSRIEGEHEDFEKGAHKVFDLLHAGKFAQARELEEYVEAAEDELDHELESLMLSLEKRVQEAADQAEKDEKRAATVLITMVMLTAMLGFGIAIQLTRSITRPINRIIEGLTDGAEQVTSASSQVSSASQSLAEGASEQAAGLEETTSSMEELVSMTRQNAQNAQQANELSTEARRNAGQGSSAMNLMNDAINEIQKSLNETAKIIKVIDEIAF